MKTKRHIVIPDTQVKPGVPTDHLIWAARFIANHRPPDHIQIMGDWWDMPSLSRWTKSSDLSAEGRRIRADRDSGYAAMELFLGELERLGLDLVKVPGPGVRLPEWTVSLGFTMGNHEKPRLERMRETHKELSDEFDPDTYFGLQDFPITVADFMQPMHVDGVTYCHLFDLNANGDTTGRRNGQTKAELQVKRVRGSSVAGHKQGYDVSHLTHPYARPWEQETFAVIAGSFYQHQEHYRGPTDGYERRGIVVIDDLNGWGKGSPRFVTMDYLQEHYA